MILHQIINLFDEILIIQYNVYFIISMKSQKLKILVIGGSGMVGYSLVKFLLKNNHDVYFTYNKKIIENSNSVFLDIMDKNMTEKIISKFEPNIVINCAALTSVDLCETNHELAEKLNIEGTQNIVSACIKNSCKLIQISTSYVFDGKKSLYSETDEALGATYYGITKMRGEEIIKNSQLKYLILRTDQPYGFTEKWQKTNSVLRVINNLKINDSLNEIEDWYNTPTYLEDFVTATNALILKESVGIFHVVGPDFINRLEWAKIVATVFCLDENKINSANSSSLNLPAKRANIRISNKKLENEIGIKMKGVKEGAEDMLLFLKSASKTPTD